MACGPGACDDVPIAPVHQPGADGTAHDPAGHLKRAEPIGRAQNQPPSLMLIPAVTSHCQIALPLMLTLLVPLPNQIPVLLL